MLCPKIKHITRAAESLFPAAQIVIDWEKLRKGRDAMSGQNSAGKDFIRATWYRNMPQQSDQEKMLPQPPYELEPAPDARRVSLPSPRECRVPPTDLRAAIEERRSVRSYADIPLEPEELSWLLWATQGVRSLWPERNVTLRTVPSAGCRHPFETYLALSRVAGIAPGIYRYLASAHELVECSTDTRLIGRLVTACHRQTFLLSAAALFFWTAVTYRSEWRYTERAWRYFFLDAGHVCQNLYLAAAPVGCGVCGVGAFDDEEVARILGLPDPADGTQSASIPVYAAAVGKLPL